MAKRGLLVLGICVLAALGAVVVFSIRRSPPPAPPTNELRDVLLLQNAQVSSLDPQDAYHAGHIHMVKQLYNTLVDVGLDGRPVASLAENWSTDDGKTWRFHLRAGVLFAVDPCFKDASHRRFTAADVRFTFERLLGKNSKSLGVSYFMGLLGAKEYHEGAAKAIAGLRVVDERTLEFELSDSDYSFPARLTLPYASVVSRDAVSYYGDEFAQHPVGTGPFVLVRHEANKQLQFKKNPEYWEKQDGQRLPYIDHLTINLMADDNLALLAFKDGLTDFLELNRPTYEQYKGMKFAFRTELASQANPQINLFLCNLRTLKSPALRKGLSYAVDRKRLQSILAEQGQTAKSLFPDSLFPQLAAASDALGYDPAKAREAIQGSQQIKLVCFEDVLSKAIATNVSDSLKGCGVIVQIEAVSFPVLVERLTKGEYDLIQIYWGLLYADPCHYLAPFLTSSFPPSGNNFNKYSNPTFDALVESALHSEGGTRSDALLKAQQVILDDMPFVLLYFKNTVRISNGRFTMPLHPLQYRLYKFAKPTEQNKKD